MELFYFEITQKNETLANNIAQLARSLGFYVSNKKSIRKIKSINFLLTLIGSICFIAMIFTLPTVISLILSSAFGMCFGLLLINYKNLNIYY